MRILVLDGNQNQAVAAVRSLAHAGHHVLVGESSSWSKAGWSRSCRGSFEYPAPQEHASAFIARIVEIARTEPGTLIMPMTEATTLPLSAERDIVFATGSRMVLPAHSDLLRAFDKSETVRLASSLGITVPKTIFASDAREAREARDSVSFPVVLKPRSSEELGPAGVVRTGGKPRYASNPAEFNAAYEQISRNCSGVLIQEFVEGAGAGFFALMHHGELRAEFAHRRIRDVRPTGSGSAVRVSVPPDPAIRNASLAMLKALNWHGVAMVEFRQQENKPPVFMEVNGRFWNSLALSCYSGVDFPALLARMAETGDVEPVNHFQSGVRCRWILGDLRHLVEVWRGAPSGYPMAYPKRLRTLLDVLTPVPGTFHDCFQWRDSLPELGDWLSLVRRLTRLKPLSGSAR
jgi:predicted ATP-grasp superfamily ATP-dependent carboligase